MQEPQPNPANDTVYLQQFDDKHLTRIRINVQQSIRNLQSYMKTIDQEVERRRIEAQPKLFDVEGK